MIKWWVSEYRFEKSKDKDLITLLRSYATVDQEIIPELPKTLRLLAIVKILSWECKLDCIATCKNDKGAAFALIERLRMTCENDSQRRNAEILSAHWD